MTENVIRMWDSLREDEYKGEKRCIGVNCRDCPFDDDMCNMYDAIEIIE